MAPGTKRIAFGGLALAILAWGAIEAWLPADPTPQPEARNADGLTAIPEVATRARPTTPTTDSLAATSPAADIAAVLVGCFRGTTPEGDTLVERYRAALDGTIEGELDQTAPDGTGRYHERMRIARSDGVWRYHPSPNGVAADVSFALVAHGGGALRFTNPDYDYPQVIEYQRRGDALETRVAGVEAGVSKQESYTTRAEPCR